MITKSVSSIQLMVKHKVNKVALNKDADKRVVQRDDVSTLARAGQDFVRIFRDSKLQVLAQIRIFGNRARALALATYGSPVL